ncbi:hypothetical protein GOBAR_AA00287 [Gossypium barbadense]|uniref:SWIM-type domain-containing protein n=1 Tax=Gossypium barbadense TaxID=3634 RepID=A0A2P5YXN3_GOSBA|nr:hypothetical protein GOBAR_AA00287 [Gossypium barbadense]
MPMKVLSIKYQFCTLVDPLSYDSFDIKGPRSLKAMVQTHLASGSLYLELYMMVGRMMSPIWIHLKSPALMVQKLDYFLNWSLFQPYLKMLKGVQMRTTKIKMYSPLAHMHNVDLYQDDALEFPYRPHRRRDRTSSSLVSGEMEVGKADPKTSVPVLIANIHSKLKYTPSYRKVWIAKQKALEKMHGRWDASYNEVWQWCQDGSGRIIPIAFAITPRESADNWDFFISRLKRNVCPQPDICVILDWGTGILAAIERQGSQWHCTHHRTCDCGVFDALRYPCTHAIAACQNLRLDPMTYVNQVYKIKYMYNVWRHVFPLIPDERKWPSVSLAPFKLLPDRELLRKPKG